jgi:hypothetical protein
VINRRPIFAPETETACILTEALFSLSGISARLGQMISPLMTNMRLRR